MSSTSRRPARPSVAPLGLGRWFGVVLAALVVASVAFALLLGLCFGLSVYVGWTPGVAIGSEVLSGLCALAVGVWMLRLALRAERELTPEG
jgi:hypothetical protein